MKINNISNKGRFGVKPLNFKSQKAESIDKNSEKLQERFLAVFLKDGSYIGEFDRNEIIDVFEISSEAVQNAILKRTLSNKDGIYIVPKKWIMSKNESGTECIDRAKIEKVIPAVNKEIRRKSKFDVNA